MDASSLRHEKTAAVPIQTNKKPYTRPAGPPLSASLVGDGQTLEHGSIIAIILLETNTKSPLDLSIQSGKNRDEEDYIKVPSQVIRMVQLNPNKDMRPNIRCTISVSGLSKQYTTGRMDPPSRQASCHDEAALHYQEPLCPAVLMSQSLEDGPPLLGRSAWLPS